MARGSSDPCSALSIGRADEVLRSFFTTSLVRPESRGSVVFSPAEGRCQPSMSTYTGRRSATVPSTARVAASCRRDRTTASETAFATSS